MSMELHVFFHSKLPTKAALTNAMKELGFPLSISPATGSLEQQSGFMPMRWRREEAGVEFDVWSGRSILDEIKADGVDPRFDRSANFRWGGEESELLCALCAAAALAKLVDGVVFDPEDDKLQSVDEAIAAARATLQQLTKPVAEKPPGANVSSLRRYLKPLLKKRPDLMLVGRMLTVRPVRHVLRGAFFHGKSDMFFVSPHANPVYRSVNRIGSVNWVHGIPEVWQPHFEPLLMDSLREDIFPQVESITGLADYAEWLAVNDNYWTFPSDKRARVVAHVLAGERERAEAYLETIANWAAHREYQAWIAELRTILNRDIDDLCKEYRALEAAAAAKLKLGGAWQPSPFPVEMPKNQRKLILAEQQFSAEPWVETPEGLWGSAPESPGDVAFARQSFLRDGRRLLVKPLKRGQAEAAHRNHEDYCMFVRLSGGELLELRHDPGLSAFDPRQATNPNFEQWKTCRLSIEMASVRLDAEFSDLYERGMFELRSVKVLELNPEREWSGSYDRHHRQVWVRDEPKDKDRIVKHRERTEADIELCQRALPEFGEYQDLLTRVTKFLEVNGYGRFLE